MRTPTIPTDPLSLTQARPTLRPGNAAARGAGLGGKPLVNFDAHCPPSGGFVLQHVSERRPAGVKNGLREFRLGEAGGVHVANGYEPVLPNNAGAFNVQEVAPAVRNLRAYGLGAPFVSCTLGGTKRSLVCAIDVRRLYSSSIAQRGESLKAEVDSYGSIPLGQVVGHLACEGGIPPAARILDECPAFVLGRHVSVLPQPICAPEVANAITVGFEGARNVGDPPKGSTLSEAGSKARASTMLVPALCKTPADGDDSIGVQAEQCAASCAQVHETNPSGPAKVRPACSASLSFALRRNAEVPNLVALHGQRIEAPTAPAIFDPELEGNDAHREPYFITRRGEHGSHPKETTK